MKELLLSFWQKSIQISKRNDFPFKCARAAQLMNGDHNFVVCSSTIHVTLSCGSLGTLCDMLALLRLPRFVILKASPLSRWCLLAGIQDHIQCLYWCDHSWQNCILYQFSWVRKGQPSIVAGLHESPSDPGLLKPVELMESLGSLCGLGSADCSLTEELCTDGQRCPSRQHTDLQVWIDFKLSDLMGIATVIRNHSCVPTEKAANTKVDGINYPKRLGQNEHCAFILGNMWNLRICLNFLCTWKQKWKMSTLFWTIEQQPDTGNQCTCTRVTQVWNTEVQICVCLSDSQTIKHLVGWYTVNPLSADSVESKTFNSISWFPVPVSPLEVSWPRWVFQMVTTYACLILVLPTNNSLNACTLTLQAERWVCICNKSKGVWFFKQMC